MKKLNIADLFCGAGGSSTGAVEAAESLGYSPQLSVVNHWDRAIDTHKANHPTARHFCTGVDNINPRDIYKDEELHILMASPECTHHSNASGGRPVNEQSRATAMCVIRWAEAVRPGVMLIENVPEFRSWGPVMRKYVTRRKRVRGRIRVTKGWELVPDPKRKGELYHAWIAMIRAIGYKVEPRIVACANYGDPTTRERLLVYCVRGKRKIVWPNPTHLEQPDSELPLNGKTWEWRSTRDHVIDWSLEGRWIDEMPGKKRYGGLPLSPNTLRRINYGFLKHGGAAFIVPQNNGHEPRSVDEPLQSVTTTSRGIRLLQPVIVKLRGTNTATSIDKPLPTVTGSGNNLYLAEPFLVNNKGKSNGASIDKPMPTQTAGAPHLYLAEPFLVPNFGERKGQSPRSHSIKKPLPTVCAGGHIALLEPQLIQVAHGVGPKEKNPHGRRVHSLRKPLPTVTGSNEFALVEAAILPQQSGGKLRPVSKPLPTVSTKGAIALIEPFVMSYYGTNNTSSVKKPLPTVTAKDRFALVCPKVVIDGQEARVRYRYRMLQWHELARGQGFRDSYKFVGNKTEKVKMIGNAVPRRTVRAHIAAAISQNPDVSYLIEQELAA